MKKLLIVLGGLVLVSYELEARKILPNSRFNGGYGRGYYGHHKRGYGPGSCWD